VTEKELRRRQRTEYAPRKVENSVTREKFEAYMAARAAALARESEEAQDEAKDQ